MFVYLSVTCDVSETSVGGRNFSFHTNGLSYSMAKADCLNQGKHLASIHNIEENMEVAALTAGNPWVWLGANEMELEGEWKWEDGSAWSFSLWNEESGEPNNYQQDEDCLLMGENKQWYDGPCSYPLPYVCAFKASAPGSQY